MSPVISETHRSMKEQALLQREENDLISRGIAGLKREMVKLMG